MVRFKTCNLPWAVSYIYTTRPAWFCFTSSPSHFVYQFAFRLIYSPPSTLYTHASICPSLSLQDTAHTKLKVLLSVFVNPSRTLSLCRLFRHWSVIHHSSHILYSLSLHHSCVVSRSFLQSRVSDMRSPQGRTTRRDSATLMMIQDLQTRLAKLEAENTQLRDLLAHYQSGSPNRSPSPIQGQGQINVPITNGAGPGSSGHGSANHGSSLNQNAGTSPGQNTATSADRNIASQIAASANQSEGNPANQHKEISDPNLITGGGAPEGPWVTSPEQQREYSSKTKSKSTTLV